MALRHNCSSLAVAAALAALLTSACTSADAGADAAAGAAPGEEESAENRSQVDEGRTVPLSEEHLAEGVEMPDGCADEAIYVESGTTIREHDLVHMCPAEPADDREFRPSQQIIDTGDGLDVRYLPGQDGAGVEVHHLHCEDEEALAEKAAHNGESQPVGWPQDWDGTGAMPDPYCHPDYLEIGEWNDLEAHMACWEGIETSTIGDTGQSQDEIDEALWQQSQARANWEQPGIETWDDMGMSPAGASPGCGASYEDP
ncbi:hypothetical protein [Nesterenkonia suensis]